MVKFRFIFMLELIGFLLALNTICFAQEQGKDRDLTVLPKQTHPASVDEVLINQNFYALFIAIDKYKGKIPALDTPVADAKSIRDMLVSKYAFPPKNITEMYDGAATRANILHKLRELAQDLDENDNLFIYFAGHGQLDDVTGTGHWVPVDAVANNFETYIPNSTIRDYIQACKAKHIYLISDSCFSGSLLTERAIPSEVSDRYYREAARRASRQVLTSGGKEPVADAGAAGHSIFAYYFLKVLQNNETNYIVPSEIFSELKVLVAGNSNQTPIQGPLRGTLDEGGEFVLRNENPNPAAVPFVNRPAEQQQPQQYAPPLAMQRTARNYKIAAYSLTAACGAALIAGGAMYALSDSAYKDFTGASNKSDADAAKSKGKGYEMGAEISGGIALAAGAGAIYFWLAKPAKHAQADKPWYVVSPATDGRTSGLFVQGAF